MPFKNKIQYSCAVTPAYDTRFQRAIGVLHRAGLISEPTKYAYTKLCLKLGLEEAIEIVKYAAKEPTKPGGPQPGNNGGSGRGSIKSTTAPADNKGQEKATGGESHDSA